MNIKYSMYIVIIYLLQISLQGDDDESDAAASMPLDYAEMDIDTIMNGKVWHKNHKNTCDSHCTTGCLSWANSLDENVHKQSGS